MAWEGKRQTHMAIIENKKAVIINDRAEPMSNYDGKISVMQLASLSKTKQPVNKSESVNSSLIVA